MLHITVRILDLPIMVALCSHSPSIFIDVVSITVLRTSQEHKYFKDLKVRILTSRIENYNSYF